MKISKDTPTILLGENKESFDASIKDLLEKRGIVVYECPDGIEVVRKAFTESPNLIIMDAAMLRLNGYQCCRVLRSNPVSASIPIILIGLPDNPIDKYWCMASGGDYYLQRPIDPEELNEILGRFLDTRSSKHRLFLPNTTENLTDISILTLANSILDRKLLRAEILNEIFLIDTSSITVKELINATMTIIHSLFDFGLGVVLFIYWNSAELFFYLNERLDQERLDNAKIIMLKQLREQYETYIDPNQISQNILESDQIKETRGKAQELYIHAADRKLSPCMLAFDNIRFDKLSEEEQETLKLVLDFVHGVLERKLLFEISQQLSIIDSVTQANSFAFFIKCLEREMENAGRHKFPISLFTINISNFGNITRDLKTKQKHDLIRHIHNFILATTRKSDIVARRTVSSFVFLLPFTNLKQTEGTRDRIVNHIREKLSPSLPSSIQLKIITGICEFNPERDLTPEIFITNAEPKETKESIEAEEPLSEKTVEKILREGTK